MDVLGFGQPTRVTRRHLSSQRATLTNTPPSRRRPRTELPRPCHHINRFWSTDQGYSSAPFESTRNAHQHPSVPPSPAHRAPPPVPPHKQPPAQSSSLSGPPPPPPPPPQNSTGNVISKRPSALTPDEPEIPLHERSIVEYPEKQSVASLRHAIEHKLNGKTPVKGLSNMQGSTESGGSTVQSPQTPQAPPPPPPAFVTPTQPPPPPAPWGAQSIKPPTSFSETSRMSRSYHASEPTTPMTVDTAIHGASRGQMRQQASPPRSFSQSSYQPLPPGGPFSPRDSPLPPRPPLPSDMSPGSYGSRSDMQSRPFDHGGYRGGSVPASRARSPPPSSMLVDRKSSLEGNQVRTDSYYATPYKETTSTSRHVPQADFMYSGVGPTDSKGTPMGLRESVPTSGGYHHHWYKMMYKKLHQIDKPEDQSVLRYRMRDYHSPDPREPQHYNSAHFYAKSIREPQEPSGYAAPYRTSDQLSEPDLEYDRGYAPRPFIVSPSGAYSRTLPRKYRDDQAGRRSKSVGRYESSSPLPAEIVKSTPASEKQYKIQPKRIENYVPGESSLAKFERDETKPEADHEIVDNWRRARSKLNHNVSLRKRSSSASARPPADYGSYGARYHYMEEERSSNRREPSPPRHEDTRHWYRTAHDGDIPYGGLGQPTPDRRDNGLTARNIVSNATYADFGPDPQPHLNSDQYWAGKAASDVTSGRYKSPGRSLDPRSAYAEFEDGASIRDKDFIMENERRKRQEREWEDQRARRHGYIPSKSPGFATERRDQVAEQSRRGRSPSNPALSPRPSGPEVRGVAKALYSFSGHNPRELSFNKGDLVMIRRQVDQNWYEAEFRGRMGICPVNYVQLAAVAETNKPLTYTEVSESQEGQARALYNFEGRSVNELNLRKGEYISLTKKVDDNWFEGRTGGGRVGIFPSNYVHVIREPRSDNRSVPAAKGFATSIPHPTPTSSRRTPKREIESTAVKLQVNGVAYQKPTGNPVPQGATNTFDIGRPGYQGVAPSAMKDSSRSSAPAPKPADHGLDVVAWELRHTAQTMGAEPAKLTRDSDSYEALYAYSPQNPDELELKEGDRVRVLEKCDDGWFIGTSLRTGMFGTFPGNYVQRL